MDDISGIVESEDQQTRQSKLASFISVENKRNKRNKRNVPGTAAAGSEYSVARDSAGLGLG